MQDTRISLSVAVDDEESTLEVMDRLNRVMASLVLEGHHVYLTAGPDVWAEEEAEVVEEQEAEGDG